MSDFKVITNARELPERGTYEVELLDLEPFIVVPVLTHLRDLLERPDMQPPNATLTVTFEGLKPAQVRLLQQQLDDGFLAAFVALLDRDDKKIADVALRQRC